MKHLAACALLLMSSTAFGAVFVKGSIAASDTNAELKNQLTRDGSATIAVGLGQYIRLGFTHRQKIDETTDYVATKASETAPVIYEQTYSKTHETANSIDLTLILYQGELFTPFLMAGGVVKSYTFEYHQGTQEPVKTDKPIFIGPVPNLGAGLSIRLNRDFGLEFSYTMSQGVAQKPGEQPVSVWDKYTSVGLTYQL